MHRRSPVFCNADDKRWTVSPAPSSLEGGAARAHSSFVSGVRDGHAEIESGWGPPPLPSRGPCWDAAIEFGIDVTLLLENLELTPTQRLARLQQANDFHELLRNAPRGGE